MSRHRSLCVALFVLIMLLAVPAVASASYWKWGYNYVGVNVNRYVNSPAGTYGVEGLYKNSGGTVLHGFTNCGQRLASGTTTWTGYPYTINPGCPPLDIGAFVNWWSGATSYLQIEAAG